MQNERLVEAERYSIKQIDELKARNEELIHDNENHVRQLRAQEEALIQAQILKDKTDLMVRDFEKMKGELRREVERNERLTREHEHAKYNNKDLETRVIELSRDNELLR